MKEHNLSAADIIGPNSAFVSQSGTFLMKITGKVVIYA
jgi:hypothetical protein